MVFKSLIYIAGHSAASVLVVPCPRNLDNNNYSICIQLASERR